MQTHTPLPTDSTSIAKMAPPSGGGKAKAKQAGRTVDEQQQQSSNKRKRGDDDPLVSRRVKVTFSDHEDIPPETGRITSRAKGGKYRIEYDSVRSSSPHDPPGSSTQKLCSKAFLCYRQLAPSLILQSLGSFHCDHLASICSSLLRPHTSLRRLHTHVSTLVWCLWHTPCVSREYVTALSLHFALLPA